MSDVHEAVVPQLHVRCRELRRELERMTTLATELAEALDAEVDLRHGGRVDDLRVAHRTGHALKQARDRGLLA